MRTFLTADWRYLLMLNYVVEPELLRSHVPPGVELDAWNGRTYLSMVGFLFQRTRVMGLSAPLHTDFEEVNLRFYVRRKAPDGWRRGVVFIKEIVPRRIIATVARVCYNEPYEAMPMRHRIDIENGNLRSGGIVEYAWHHEGEWNALRATAIGAPRSPGDNSEEEFITEHFWGYTKRRNGGCAEYHVEHPRWNVWPARDPMLNCNAASLYGGDFTAPLRAQPQSAFIAQGSLVSVSTGTTLKSRGHRKSWPQVDNTGRNAYLTETQ